MKYQKPVLYDLSGREIRKGTGWDSPWFCMNGNKHHGQSCHNGNQNTMGPCRNGNWAKGWHQCQNGNNNTGS